MTVLEQYSLSITCYYEIKERRKKGGINTKILKNRHHVDSFFSPGRRKAVSDNWRSRGPAATHLPFACVLASLMTDRLRLSCFTRKETEELRNSCVPGHAASMVWGWHLKTRLARPQPPQARQDPISQTAPATSAHAAPDGNSRVSLSLPVVRETQANERKRRERNGKGGAERGRPQPAEGRRDATVRRAGWQRPPRGCARGSRPGPCRTAQAAGKEGAGTHLLALTLLYVGPLCPRCPCRPLGAVSLRVLSQGGQ